MEDIASKPICLDCLYDAGLKKLFTGGFTPTQKGDCAYCDKRSILTISSLDVQRLIREYCLVDKTLSVAELGYCTREGGWQGKTYDPDDLLDKCSGAVCDELFAELQEALNTSGESFCDADHNLMPQTDRWMHSWGEFTSLIKHRCRFLFGQIGDQNPDRNPDEPSPEEFIRHYLPTALDRLRLQGVRCVRPSTSAPLKTHRLPTNCSVVGA